MLDLIHIALSKGAKPVGSISGGKDGQAMVKAMAVNGIQCWKLIHCDLGSVEWPESMDMCRRTAEEFGVELKVLRRKDGLGLLEYWKRRLNLLKGTGKPFWSSSKARYCTSDLKREPSNQFFRSCGENFIISCEGIRAQESPGRAKKSPLSIRAGVTSSYYKNMTVEEAIAAYNPKKRLVLTWYPIFQFTVDEVWATYQMDSIDLASYRRIYTDKKYVHRRWPFHPAYIYGNERVSCMMCILGSPNDLKNGAKHNPALLQEMIAMEEEGNATFKDKWSLKNLLPQ